MKKDMIMIYKKPGIINFYLVTKAGRYFLFSQDFSKGVFEFFRRGKSFGELRSFKRWRKNPRLDKTIEKLPLYVQYVLKEEGLALAA